MRPWKAAVGIGAACAMCCAVPLVGGAAALTAGTAMVATLGSALLACADELVPLAFGLLALAALGAAVVVWRKRQSRLAAIVATPKACGCPPGACG